MFNYDSSFVKYNLSLLRNFDQENTSKIISFLVAHNCSFIEELLEDYLDLFAIDHDTFVNKFNYLNKKYQNHYLDYVSQNMNLLEEFYN